MSREWALCGKRLRPIDAKMKPQAESELVPVRTINRFKLLSRATAAQVTAERRQFGGACELSVQ